MTGNVTKRQKELFAKSDPAVLGLYYELREWLGPWELVPKLKGNAIHLGYGSYGKALMSVEPQKKALLVRIYGPEPIDNEAISRRSQDRSERWVHEIAMTTETQCNDIMDVMQSAYDAEMATRGG